MTAWAVSSALALATHYFAIFLIVPQAIWLLKRHSRERVVQVGTALVGISALVLAPLALHQRSANPVGEEGEPLATRLVKIPKEWLTGFGTPGRNLFAVLAAILVFYGLILLVRRTSASERRGAVALGIIVALMVALPMGLAVAGADYFNPIYVVVALPPALIVLATGFATSRAGIVAAALLMLVSLATIFEIERGSAYQRTDWRAAVAEMGLAHQTRAIMVIGSAGRFSPVDFYARRSSRMHPGGQPVEEVVLLGLGKEVQQARLTLPGTFREVASRRVQQLSVRVFRSREARWVSPKSLRNDYHGTFPRARIRVLTQSNSSK
jgi:hypothetical protein